MYYILIRGRWRPGKNINHFLQWFEAYREEQKRWGVLTAQVFCGWFGSEHHFTCLYGVESVDRWSAGQDTASGVEAIFAVDEVVETGSLKFEVLKEIPVEF